MGKEGEGVERDVRKTRRVLLANERVANANNKKKDSFLGAKGVIPAGTGSRGGAALVFLVEYDNDCTFISVFAGANTGFAADIEGGSRQGAQRSSRASRSRK